MGSALSLPLTCMSWICLSICLFAGAPTGSLLLLPPEMTRCRLCTQQGFDKHVTCEWMDFSSPSTQDLKPRIPERKLNSFSTLASGFRLLKLTTAPSFPDRRLMEVLMRPSGHQKERERKSNSLINPQIIVTDKKRSYFL